MLFFDADTRSVPVWGGCDAEMCRITEISPQLVDSFMLFVSSCDENKIFYIFILTKRIYPFTDG